MGKKCSSQLHHVLGLVLLLYIFPCLSQSAPFSAIGSVNQIGKRKHTQESSPGRIYSAKLASTKLKARHLKGKKSIKVVEKTHQLEGEELNLAKKLTAEEISGPVQFARYIRVPIALSYRTS